MTALHIFVMAIALSGHLTLTVLLSSPIVVAMLVSLYLKRFETRCLMLAFCNGFSIFSVFAFYFVTTGEHDAQWQLEFFKIPLFGLPAAVAVSVIALIRDATGTDASQ